MKFSNGFSIYLKWKNIYVGLYDFTFYDLINRNAVSYKEKAAWFTLTLHDGT